MDTVALLEAISIIILKIKFLLNDQISKHLLKLLEMQIWIKYISSRREVKTSAQMSEMWGGIC